MMSRACRSAWALALAVCGVVHLACAQAPNALLDGHGFAITPHPLDLLKTKNVRFAWENSAQLRVNTTTLARSGEWVEVLVSGVAEPRFDDFVVLHAPADADPRSTAPLKYKFLSNIEGYLQKGTARLRFRLLNVRQAQVFYLVRNGLDYPVYAALSEAVRPANAGEPTQRHLALTGRPDELRVMWVSAAVGQPKVRWGDAPGQLHGSTAAQSDAFSRDDMCGPPANATGWLDPGLLHSAVLTDLQPGKQYFYVVGSDEGGWSEEAGFQGPLGADPDREVEFLAVADLGQTEVDDSLEIDAIAPMSGATIDRMQREMLERNSSFLVLNGDLSYARGFAVQWETFFDLLAPIVTRAPLMTVPGNHERDWPRSGDRFGSAGVWDSGGECGVPYMRRLGMPQGPGGSEAPWYSFDHGPIHILQYSTEHAFEPGSPQYDFMEADLAGIDRSQTPWVIVGGHRPLYVDSTFAGLRPDSDQAFAAAARAALEPLFLEHGVDVTWHGHHHSYQRTCPLAAGRCRANGVDGVANAPVHLVIGHAGAVLTPNTTPVLPSQFQKVQLEHGYVRVRANATFLEHTVLSTVTGEVMDRLELWHPAGWCDQARQAGTRCTWNWSVRWEEHPDVAQW